MSDGVRTIRGKHYTRVRLEKQRRISVPLTGCASKADATARAARIRVMADELIAAGRWFDVEQPFARGMGAAKTEREVRLIEEAAKRLAAIAPGAGTADKTFSGFASRWTSGGLAREYPDHVPPKDSRGDLGILNLYINPVIGHLPLTAITLDHADSVMRTLPPTLGPARRRHVAQVVHRVLALAAYPAKLIAVSPIPKGWLPKLGKGKALQYIYPDEDRQLLGSTDVDLEYRVLYGVLAREGMRVSEALALDWTDIDLGRGGISLDENKSDDPRAWALDPSVVVTLKWWRAYAPKEGPFKALTDRHLAERFRDDLAAAGVTREALTRRTDKRRPIRAHDLRASFITISLANGRTESWVQDRTGHTSTLMIARYRRASRTVAELGLGPLAPLDSLLPEMQGGDQVGQQSVKVRVNSRAKKARNRNEVAPPGLEPGRPSGPEILKPMHVAPEGASPGKTRDPRSDSQPLAKTDPHSDPHPTHGPPTWRDHADFYDRFVAEEAGVDLPRRRKG